MHVIAQTKVAKMHALGHRTLKAPAPEMVFGDIDCRHCPDQKIVKRYRNRRSDLLQRKIHATAIDSNVLSGYSGVKPKKIPIADPRAIECGESAIVINVM